MDVGFGPPFGDGMVLQRRVGGLKAQLWGTAEPRSRFSLQVGQAVAAVKVGRDGRWKTKLDVPPGGPYQLIVDGKPRFENVWSGDVWLCGGQSNMERSLLQGVVWPSELPEGCAEIRQMSVAGAVDFVSPRGELATRWFGADSGVASFSAAAFSFAQELWRRTGVPQGMIQTAVGGSSAQAWLSARSLRHFPAYRARAAQLASGTWLADLKKSEAARRDAWYAAVDASDPKDPERAGRGDWKPLHLPSFEPTAFDAHIGTVWLRRRFAVGSPSDDLRLSLGTLIEADDAWINGVWVGSTGYQYPSRRYPVPASLLKADNELLIRLVVPRGGGRITYGKPVRLWSESGDLELDLSGPWEWRVGATAGFLPDDTFLPKEPLGLYNAVLSPLAGLAVRAVLWYQGESNIGDPHYGELQRAVYAEFRRLWRVPFIAVQLPLFGAETDDVSGSLPAIREAQRGLLELPATGLVVALDQGEWNDIHPARKDEVGRRLALAARRLVLGDDLVWTGPLCVGYEREGNELRLEFRQTGEALSTRDGRSPGAFFVEAEGIRKCEAVIEGTRVMLRVPTDASAVYYAWADNPAGANLVNEQGLPAAPFRVSIRGRRRRG